MGEIGNPVLAGILNSLACFAGPALPPGILAEEVKLVVDDALDLGANIAQVAPAHLI
jgi:hypothetical protein